jgi:hypothetical protein
MYPGGINSVDANHFMAHGNANGTPRNSERGNRGRQMNALMQVSSHETTSAADMFFISGRSKIKLQILLFFV